MSNIKTYNLDQYTSDLIYYFFDGDIDLLTKQNVAELSNNPENFKIIKDKDKRELLKIIKYRDNKKIDYRILLKEKSKTDFNKLKIVNKKKTNKIDDTIIDEYILPQRKAYIKYINDVFYPNLIKNMDDNFKIYQNFVKYYLSINSPYRGLLVYHGLGTGKTATSIITAEGLSNSIPITTLLPASLESNFIYQVKLWGDQIYKIDKTNWKFIELSIIKSDSELRTFINDNYNLNVDKIQQIFNSLSRTIKDQTLQPGIWLNSEDINEKDILKSITGYFIKDMKQTNIKLTKLTENEIEYINRQMLKMIELKYNFIHYNPLPSLTIKEKDSYTDNEKISIKLLKNLKLNKKKYINSPFDDEVIIIDEVHNFVREIYNNSGESKTYYDWIVNGENLKLVFLSGTPIINRPSEIAILANMLKGIIKVYTFSINQEYDLETLNDNLKNIFYTKYSPIQQFYIKIINGKLYISFIKNKSKFLSLLNDSDDVIYTYNKNDYTLKEFFEFIYKGLRKLFDLKNVIPSSKNINDKLKDILNGKSIIFDKTNNIKFNIHQKLFDIYKNDGNIIDLTNNESFMEYFFTPDETKIIPAKRILLKRMLMGLISYYPIDRSAIKVMPEIIKPLYNSSEYSNYEISRNINIVDCTMSYKQFLKYEEVYKESKLKSLKSSMFGNDLESSFDYHIRIRQACNMIYENDDFRKIKSNEENKLEINKLKQKEYKMLLESNVLKIDRGLKILSPKFYEILTRVNKFVDETGKPIGKILFYSEFRSDSGGEIFEKVLEANGYEKYDYTKPPTNSKKYTFYTGEENKLERKKNLEAFKNKNNIYGEQIQIMIISGAGAEGISLTGIRQVHILEPYWNYVRIDQVFGRAIRMESHEQLPESKRNVEQYIYLSKFPKGTTIKEVYDNIKQLNNWNIPRIEDQSDIVNILFTSHKDLYDNIQKIIKLKIDTKNSTADEMLFETMNKKYNISQEMIRVVQEASVDCIQNTRDDMVLNENCIRFDKDLLNEDAYFPGIDDETIYNVDKKQIESKFMCNLEKNIYILSAKQNERNVFAYYKINSEQNIDIRYIRDNGLLLGILDIDLQLFFKYVDKEYSLNKIFGSKFSVFQEIYFVDDSFFINIKECNNFPTIKQINKLIGYKIKNNVSETFLFYPNDTRKIIRLYPYNILLQNNFQLNLITPYIYNNDKIYQSNFKFEN